MRSGSVARTDVNVYRLRPDEFTIYRGHCVLITDSRGRIGSGLEGLYFRRTRFLSRCILRVDGAEPDFVSANPVEPHTMTSYHLAGSPAGAAAGPPGDHGGGGEIAHKAIEIQLNRFVGGGLHLDVHVTNHGLAEAMVAIGFELDADFADHSEAAEGERQQQAPVSRSWAAGESGAELTFVYRHPDLPHAAVLRFAGPGQFSDHQGTVSCKLMLRPQERATFCIDVEPIHCRERTAPFYGIDGTVKGDPEPERLRAGWVQGCTRLRAANPLVQAAWDRAVADLGSLHLLEGEGVEQYTLAAGIPKYSGLFGRDALMAAWQSALLNPATLRGTLRLLGQHQARERDDKFDAEPGKILHQRELGPLAMLGRTPFLHYYGDYSAPALFLLGLATDFAATADREFLLGERDKAVAVLEWMERDGDRDSDGFYEYQSRAGDQGIKNQGWKDSDQAILYEDGGMVPDPIATCEIQGLYYAAKLALGRAFTAAGERALGAALVEQATVLKRRFNERFWMPDQRFIALALDPDKRQVRSIASNAGECLAWGIVDGDRAAAVAERLMAPDMFSGWGIRTLSSSHPAYNPLAYHLGSVWPFANALTAVGLKRYGCIDALQRLAEAMFQASELFHLNRLPEVFGGHSRDPRHPHPGVYPGASAPQAWSASAIVLLLQAMLGIVPLAPIDVVLVDPCLPAWLPELTLTGLRVGGSRVAISFRRDATGRTLHQVDENTGGTNVLRPDAPVATSGDAESRMAAAIAAAIP
jgi:glycogen debranching enzyme